MTTLLTQFGSLASILALLLPPGWCSGMACCELAGAAIYAGSPAPVAGHTQLLHSAKTAQQSSGTQHSSCCLKTAVPAEDHPQQVAQTSALPQAETCCCTTSSTFDQAIPPQQTKTPVTSTTAAVMAVEPGLLLSAAEANLPCVTAGPRLHLLHCVWRC